MRHLLFILFGFCCNIVTAQIDFQNQASTLGFNSHTGPTIFGGSGVSFVDYNGDGFDDITLTRTDNSTVSFYKNIDGVFFQLEDLLPSSGNYEYRTRNATWIDYDNDGDKDLFLTSDTDGNRLFQNQSGSLVDVTIQAGLPTDNVFTFGASWGDFNNDGCLDVYLSNRSLGTLITNYLFMNNCDGTFTDATNSSGVSAGSVWSFCSAFFDFNNDGYQDIYIANDKTTPNYLFKNNGDGTFSDVSVASGTDIVVGAMSVTVDDYDSDGYFDIFVTNSPNGAGYDAPGTVLLKNNGDETFSNVTTSTQTSLVTFSWGSNFLDADNDGDLDLYINSQYTSSDSFPSYGFYINNNLGSFSLSNSSGFTTNDYNSYSSAIGDYNNDGKLEIISNNGNSQNPSFWENMDFSTNNYLSIALEGNMSNKDGIGSIIEISIGGSKQYRTLLGGESYMAQNSFTEHFGVGTATTVDYVKVKWLSGLEDILYNVSVNQKLSVVEGTALSTYDFDDVSLSYYPNPVKNTLTINAQQNVENITMYNMLGQEVIRSFPNSVDTEVDMSSLFPGTYFVKVSIQGNTKTIRVIKQ
ncbi:FG-GAP-like repeat-containing protein [Winogradskyella jejuensis]|uniref:Por secretion system C-terminal sorting domain-containing protein n=1 Tax=Winogradskyella jejuensis TaxID=1089305 RepID=A0A1M5VPT5_9FLAO|nr:FG-GAP-like repeat-containing protein [Winogradskyella jejuensis]SHH76933.1 Por secretion system C-terminal sorting domain-containing protein [Winogradskyella jejuensis]